MGKARPLGLVKPFEKECGPGVTALVLRLLEPWFNSGRTIQLDSGFCVLLLMAALATKGEHDWPVI